MVKRTLSVALALWLGASVVSFAYAIDYEEAKHDSAVSTLEQERALALERARNRAREQIAAQAKSFEQNSAASSSSSGNNEIEIYAQSFQSLKDSITKSAQEAQAQSRAKAKADLDRQHQEDVEKAQRVQQVKELLKANSAMHESRNNAASARAAAVQTKDLQESPVKEDRPSLLRRIFGLGNTSEANSVVDVRAANGHYLNLKVFGNVETLMSTADGSENLLKTIPFKLSDDMLIAYEDKQQNMAEELHKGISFIAYLFHMYTPQASTYQIPTFFVNAHHLNQARAGVALGTKGSYQKLVVSSQGSSKSYPLYHLNMVRDQVYQEGPCEGLSYIEADLKGKCKADQKYNGVLLLSMPIPEIEKEGIYTGVPRQTTPNVLKANFFAQGMEVGARFIGFHTSFDEHKQAFNAPLHSLDKHLYSPTLKGFIDDKTSYKTIGKDCTKLDKPKHCQLYFVGSEVNRLLAPGNEDTDFNLHAKASLELGTPDVNIAPQAIAYEVVAKDELLKYQEFTQKAHSQAQDEAKLQAYSKNKTFSLSKDDKDTDKSEVTFADSESDKADGYSIVPEKVDLYGIPVSFTPLGKPTLHLRNTILSSDQYKNYTFLTELEMALLSDLGYRLEPREFFGNSIYSFGTAEQRITRYARRPYAFYDHRAGTYNIKRPSRMPLGVGLHIYGSYNDVIHGSIVSSMGEGSIGVRVDGSHNYYYQTPKSSIVTSGDDSVGIGFNYGCDNRAYISGYVGALGSRGIGIRVDMGSNIYSDFIEYRGSYVRVRTLDFLQGTASEEQVSKVPLLDDLKGPQVQDLIIDGVVEGARAAIWIDESSLVKNIFMTADAVVNGGIVSYWNPIPSPYEKGTVMLYHDVNNTKLAHAQVQLPASEFEPGLSVKEVIERKLTTDINLGVLLNEFNQPILQDAENQIYEGNEKSRVVLAGDISGSSLNIRHFAGKSTILGNVNANRVIIHSGIFNLSGPSGAIHKIKDLTLRSNTVIDYVNGETSHTFVSGNINLGRNVTVRVDVDPDGMPLDDLSYAGQFLVANYQLTVEPGVNYIDMRRLGADPKAFMNFMANFVDKCNQHFAKEGVMLRFPHYLWDNAGGYGREIKCTARGCHLGNFVSAETRPNFTDVQTWRYYVSFIGLLVLILCFYGYYYLHWFGFARSKS